MLLVTGAPGIGKTYQLTSALMQFEVTPYHFDASMIESKSANDPVRRLKETVIEVAQCNISGRPSVLIIDDADLLLGRFEMTQYTHNLQHVVQELMKVTQDGQATVPIFAVANDLNSIHAPLFRFGRARHFHWVPGLHEIVPIVETMFPELTLASCEQLVSLFPDQPVAFFADLRDSLLDAFWLSTYDGENVADALRRFASSKPKSMPTLEYSEDQVIALARRIVNTRETIAIRGADSSTSVPRRMISKPASLLRTRRKRAWL